MQEDRSSRHRRQPSGRQPAGRQPSGRQPTGRGRSLLVAPPFAALALVLAGCGSSSTSSTASTTTASGGVTVAAANVAGIGTVLVNGQGRTLYILTSEKGGKLTCTDDNGCTKTWPDTELPSGVKSATAGAGIQSSMLGTVANPAGNLYVTYAGWPLYTFSGDPGPGKANGAGIMSFGGTWEVLTPAGTPVPPPTGTTTTKSGYNGY